MILLLSESVVHTHNLDSDWACGCFEQWSMVEVTLLMYKFMQHLSGSLKHSCCLGSLIILKEKHWKAKKVLSLLSTSGKFLSNSQLPLTSLVRNSSWTSNLDKPPDDCNSSRLLNAITGEIPSDLHPSQILDLQNCNPNSCYFIPSYFGVTFVCSKKKIHNSPPIF